MIKVAIIEDDAEFRELWCDILNHTEGYKCCGNFNSVEDAVYQIPLLKADVVLVDIDLKAGGNGIDCVQQLYDKCSETQFMMFTIFHDDEHLFEALKAGATGYILKKENKAKVLAAIEELHNGGSPMSSALARRVLESMHMKTSNKLNITLNEQEISLLKYLDDGLLYKEISGKMKISIGMVKQNCHTIYRKLQVSNRTEAVNKYKGR